MDDSLYTCLITIHRASNVPVSDWNNFSCDPYCCLEIIAAEHDKTGREIQSLTYRTQTARRTRDPVFDAEWIVSGIPARGFKLSLILKDEDPGNYDDKLGEAHIHVPELKDRAFQEGWESGEQEYKVHKRKGAMKSKIGTYVARVVTRGRVRHRCRIWVSVRVLGKAEDQEDRRLYTIGPHRYFQHFCPVLGSFLGSTKAPNEVDGQSSLKASTFVANRLQLSGPVPASLRHRYVGFSPFIKAMFKKQGIQGYLLHRALHRQHCLIYHWDKYTLYGVVGRDQPVQESNGDASGSQDRKGAASESDAFAQQLLRMTSHGTHGRIFTYVIMLDGEWRFTETGEEFTIQFLSKHTMHTDVSIEIAFSGEFFIRKLSEHERHADDQRDNDPSHYELVIDNDSGTYRPRKELLPTLQEFLASPRNLASFGRITAMDGFDEELNKWKKERAQVKAQARKGKAVQNGNGKVVQASVSRSSSSVSASSVSSEEGQALGRTESVNSSEVENALQEAAKRAEENQDQDPGARAEEQEAAKQQYGDILTS